MMKDKYRIHSAGLESPAWHSEPITPGDAADLECASRAVAEGTQFLAAGIASPIRVARVWDAGTNATSIVALS